MDPALLISLIVSGVFTIFASVTAPLILAHRTEKMHREDRLAGYRRQDEVAKRAQEAAELVSESQKEAARLLLADNERVARTQQATNDKLDVIHVLVNSNMTAAMQSEYDAVKRELAVMRELMELKRVSGQQPTADVRAAIVSTEIKLTELSAALEDRAKASSTRIVAAAAAADPGAGVTTVTTTTVRGAGGEA